MREAILYARVSTAEQAREGFSIPAQLALLREYAERRGLQVTGEFYEAETAKSAGREKFREMLDCIRAQKKPVALLVEKTDRLYRNFKDFIAIDDLIMGHDLEVHLVKESEVIGRAATSHTKLIHGIKVVLAKNYIDNLSEEIKKGRRQKILNGGWPHKAPYGYKNERKEIIPHPEQAAFVREAFRLFSSGLYSLERCAEKLHESGFVYTPSKPRCPKASLCWIILNPFYTGQMEIEGVVYPGKHEPLVDLETWLAAQHALRKDNKPLQFGKQDFKYKGLMTCAECGGPVIGEYKKGGRYTYYRCARSQRGCSSGYVNESKIDPQFDAIIQALNIPADVRAAILDALREVDDCARAQVEEDLADINRQIQKAQDQRRRAYQDRLEGVIDEDMFREVSASIEDKLRGLKVRHGRIAESDVSQYELADELLELLETLHFTWIHAALAEKTGFLKNLCSNLLLEGENVRYTLKEPWSLFESKALWSNWWKSPHVVRMVFFQHGKSIRTALRSLVA